MTFCLIFILPDSAFLVPRFSGLGAFPEISEPAAALSKDIPGSSLPAGARVSAFPVTPPGTSPVHLSDTGTEPAVFPRA